MHDATVTIVQKSLSKSGKTFTLTAETGEMFSVFPPEAAFIEVGQRYTLEYTSSDFQGKTYHTVKKVSAAAKASSISAATGNSAIAHADGGPHLAMWEKEVFRAMLKGGESTADIRLKGIEARQAAREILKTNLDGKLPEFPGDDPNDSLEF